MGLRPLCVVCEREQTDLVFIHQDINRFDKHSLGNEIHVGFPVCDDHDITDIAPDQYVMNNLVVEVW